MSVGGKLDGLGLPLTCLWGFYIEFNKGGNLSLYCATKNKGMPRMVFP